MQWLLSLHAETSEMFASKNADYGDAFATYGPIGVIVRIGDKIQRISSITKSGTILVQTESMRDTLVDLLNYCTMAVMLIDENSDNNRYDNNNETRNKDSRITQFANVKFDTLDLFIEKQAEYSGDFVTRGPIEIIVQTGAEIQKLLKVTTDGIVVSNNNNNNNNDGMLQMRDVLLNLCNYSTFAIMFHDDKRDSQYLKNKSL